MLTFGAGSTAVARQQDGIIALQLRTVLFDVLTIYFPEHFATTDFLLPNRKGGKTQNRRVITSPILKVLNLNFSATTAECKVIRSELCQPVSVRIVGTYRFTGALDAMHDAEGFPQIWVPRVLQRVKPASE